MTSLGNKQYDVVLVNPPPEAYVEMYDQPDYPSIGIAYVGSYLEKHGGITPGMIDARLGRYSFRKTIEKIIASRARIVGISSFTHTILTAAAVAEQVKDALPDVSIVLGGFHGTFLPERTLREFPVFDYVVAGEGEIAFLKLVQSLLSGQSCELIRGVCLRKNGQVINNGRGEVPATLDELGEPGWHLFDPDVMMDYCKTIPVITQRGCPFGCNFCSRPYGRKVRKRTTELVVNEIEKNIRRYRVKKIEFYDETFSVNKRLTKVLCKEILKREMDIKWTCTSHVNTIDEELVQLMKASGCVDVRLGVESGNADIINEMNKGITKQRILDVHKMFKDAGLPTTAFFILGHPYETKKTIWDTIKFAVRVNAERTVIGIMVPYPGTKVWDMATKGLGGYKKLSAKWSDYNKQLGNAVNLENISRREIEIAQIVGYALVYILNLRLKDFYKMFKDNYRLAIGIVLKIFSGRMK
jgi:anaerobic magnesium-protoporphyrin IX monomethyl ester cyclase